MDLRQTEQQKIHEYIEEIWNKTDEASRDVQSKQMYTSLLLLAHEGRRRSEKSVNQFVMYAYDDMLNGNYEMMQSIREEFQKHKKNEPIYKMYKQWRDIEDQHLIFELFDIRSRLMAYNQRININKRQERASMGENG